MGGKCGEPSTLGMEGRDRNGRQGMSDRRDEWSNNKMLTEAVDMTIWLAENMRVWIGCRRSEANGDEDSRNGMGM
jgi:hypothetical protein